MRVPETARPGVIRVSRCSTEPRINARDDQGRSPPQPHATGRAGQPFRCPSVVGERSLLTRLELIVCRPESRSPGMAMAAMTCGECDHADDASVPGLCGVGADCVVQDTMAPAGSSSLIASPQIVCGEISGHRTPRTGVMIMNPTAMMPENDEQLIERLDLALHQRRRLGVTFPVRAKAMVVFFGRIAVSACRTDDDRPDRLWRHRSSRAPG